MKKIIILVIAITSLFFWSPWMDEDIIREISQEEDVKTELDQLTNKYSYNLDTKIGCDGLSSRWAPFGRKIKYCDHRSWYVTFWGKRLGAKYQPQTQEQTVSISPIVDELQTQAVPEITKQDKGETTIIDKSSQANTTVFRGFYFDIEYPKTFTVKPTSPTTVWNKITYVQTDEAYFTSPDGSVEFFVYSPLWSGDPENYLTITPTEEIVSEKTETGQALPHQLKDSERVIRWVTLKAKDGSYYRSFVSIKEQVKDYTGSEWSELHHVFGIKYRDSAAYEQYRGAYVAFKESLQQYAD